MKRSKELNRKHQYTCILKAVFKKFILFFFLSKIKDSEKEISQLKAYNETAASLKQKLQSESDEKKKAEICLGIGKIQQEWLENLKGQSAKADPSKESVRIILITFI